MTYGRPRSFTVRSGRRAVAVADGERVLLKPAAGSERFSVNPSFFLSLPKRRQIWGNAHDLVIEVGSGQGEQLEWASARFKNLNFLALEVFPQGVEHTVKRLLSKKCENAKLAQVDAYQFFSSALQEESVFEVWTFFPDPWPKAKHHKRRLISGDFASLVRRALIPGGHWRIATDDWDYALQIHETLDAGANFENEGKKEELIPLIHVGKGNRSLASCAPKGRFLQSERFEDRILTSFEKKGIKAGRTIFDFDYKKT